MLLFFEVRYCVPVMKHVYLNILNFFAEPSVSNCWPPPESSKVYLECVINQICQYVKKKL